MSTVADGLFQYGGAPVGMPVSLVPNLSAGQLGKAFFVDTVNGSDSNSGTSLKEPLATLSAAHALMVANRNDVAYVVGNSSASSGAVRESTTLAWTKDMCHIVGLNANNRISHRVSIRATSGATVFSPLVNVTADGCTFANFHVFHGFASATTQEAWVDDGQRNSYFNVHFGGMGNATAGDQAGGRSLVLTGDGERYFKSCTIGLDTVARSTTNAELELRNGAVRDIFEDCLFITFADNAGHLFIKADATAAAIDRFTIFERCKFINAFESTATTMTEAIAAHAALTGVILLKDCTLVGATDWENAASGKVMIDGAAPTAASSGLAVDVA